MTGAEAGDRPEQGSESWENIYLEPLEFSLPPLTEGPIRRVEQTRALLAYILVGVLATVVFVLLGLLGEGILSSDEFSSVAGVLIAPLVGLVGAATGYYYGKGDR